MKSHLRKNKSESDLNTVYSAPNEQMIVMIIIANKDKWLDVLELISERKRGKRDTRMSADPKCYIARFTLNITWFMNDELTREHK